MESGVKYPGCCLLLGILARTVFHRQYGQDSPKFGSVLHPLATTIPESLEASFLLLKPQTTPYQNTTVEKPHISSNTSGGKTPE